MNLSIKNGQSTLEYVIILAVVVAAIIAAAAAFKPAITKAYNTIYSNQ
jgi:Flp pilus assembly pilin Flp